MCFSAEASFIGGSVLTTIGILAIGVVFLCRRDQWRRLVDCRRVSRKCSGNHQRKLIDYY